MKLTEKEKELIEAIRNYLKSKHNPSISLEYYVRELFERMMDGEQKKRKTAQSGRFYFNIKKYNFPERYGKDWKISSRYVYIYMYENEPIWGITAEIICDFVRTLKEEGKVGFYEYKQKISY